MLLILLKSLIWKNNSSYMCGTLIFTLHILYIDVSWHTRICRTSDRTTWKIYFFKSPFRPFAKYKCRNTWKTHRVGTPLFGLQRDDSHTRIYCNFSNCRPLYPAPVLSDHMALDIEGYLISVNRFYRHWKYWKHFRLLRDFERVVFQVDIKLQRFGVIFQNVPTDRYTPTATSIVIVFFNILRKLIHLFLNWDIIYFFYLLILFVNFLEWTRSVNSIVTCM